MNLQRCKSPPWAPLHPYGGVLVPLEALVPLKGHPLSPSFPKGGCTGRSTPGPAQHVMGMSRVVPALGHGGVWQQGMGPGHGDTAGRWHLLTPRQGLSLATSAQGLSAVLPAQASQKLRMPKLELCRR